jgi:hypothetical protein
MYFETRFNVPSILRPLMYFETGLQPSSVSAVSKDRMSGKIAQGKVPARPEEQFFTASRRVRRVRFY